MIENGLQVHTQKELFRFYHNTAPKRLLCKFVPFFLLYFHNNVLQIEGLHFFYKLYHFYLFLSASFEYLNR